MASRTARVSAGAVAAPLALLGATAAFNQLCAPFMGRNLRPSFEPFECTSTSRPSRVIVGFHGLLWCEPKRWSPIEALLREYGIFIATRNGADVTATPAATIAYLRHHGLLDLDVHPIGLSMGSRTLLAFLDLYRKATGRSVSAGTVIGGMPSRRHILWPHWLLPILVEYLAAGPPVKLGWNYYCQARYRAEYATLGPDRALDNLKANQSLHARSLISGTRVLNRCRHPGRKFADTRLFVIEQDEDPLVRRSYYGPYGWQAAFPNSRHVVIPGQGHVALAEYPKEHNDALRAWLNDTSPLAVAA